MNSSFPRVHIFVYFARAWFSHPGSSHHDATLTILHVVDINSPAALTHCGPAKDLMRRLWVTGAAELSLLKKSLEANRTKAQTLIVEGLPPEAIVENSSGFDLLVIGEPRPKSAWKFFARHTARRVIEQAECPVLVLQQNTRPVGHMFAAKEVPRSHTRSSQEMESRSHRSHSSKARNLTSPVVPLGEQPTYRIV